MDLVAIFLKLCKTISMNVVESLRYSHELLKKENIPHALIGGMALSEYGYGRGTQDVDWLIPEESAERVKTLLLGDGFTVFHEQPDVMQFEGKAPIDFIIARRPISQEMLRNATLSQTLDLPVVLVEDLIGLKIQAYAGNPRRIHKELSDIGELIDRCDNLNWEKIKFYADFFNEWETLLTLKRDESNNA